jgi:hypothetical protein
MAVLLLVVAVLATVVLALGTASAVLSLFLRVMSKLR